MPNKCSIIRCGATISRNRPNLTFHRLPQSMHRKKTWLEVIGRKNLRTNLKNIYICSLHFDEYSFNRTLDVIRLKDDAVPSLFVEKPSTLHQSLQSALIARNENQPSISLQSAPVSKDDNSNATRQQTIELQPSISLQSVPVSADDNSNAVSQQTIELDQALKKFKRLQEKVYNQKKKIKCLNETVRRQRIKIATFKEVIKELKENNW